MHELTDKGWRRCEDAADGIELAGAVGPAGPAAVRGAAPASTATCAARTSAWPTCSRRRRPGPDGLESRIRAAYAKLPASPQDWVRLAELRPLLNGADKDEVDQRAAGDEPGPASSTLAPDSNRKALTDADRAAAVRIGE